MSNPKATGPYTEMPFLVDGTGSWHALAPEWAGRVLATPAAELTPMCQLHPFAAAELVVAVREGPRQSDICVLCAQSPAVSGEPTMSVWKELFHAPSPQESEVLGRTLRWFTTGLDLRDSCRNPYFLFERFEEVGVVSELAVELSELSASPLVDQRMRDHMRSLFGQIVSAIMDLEADEAAVELPSLTWFAIRSTALSFYTKVFDDFAALGDVISDELILEALNRIFSAADRGRELRTVAEEWASTYARKKGGRPDFYMDRVVKIFEFHVEGVEDAAADESAATVLLAVPSNTAEVAASTFNSSVLSLVWDRFGVGRFSDRSEGLDWLVLDLPQPVADWVARRGAGLHFVGTITDTGATGKLCLAHPHYVGHDNPGRVYSGELRKPGSLVVSEPIAAHTAPMVVNLLRDGVTFADAYATCLELQ